MIYRVGKDMMRTTILSSIFAFCLSMVHAADLEDGDIVFQRTKSRMSDAIAAASRSEYTHVGVVFHEGGKAYVYEAVQPVKRTPLSEWIKFGVDEKYEVKRIRDREGINFAAVLKQAKSYIGKNYDSEFRWSDDKIYCSELVWKSYKEAADLELGAPKKLRDFDLSSKLVKQKLVELYQNKIPYDMKVISPECIFSSELLVTVPQKPEGKKY